MQYLAIRESPESEKSGKSTPYGLTGDLIGKETCPTIIALTHVAFCCASVVLYCEPILVLGHVTELGFITGHTLL